MVERCVRDAEAAGSSPVTSTIDSRIYKIRFVSHLLKENHRGVAQVVAHQTGGLGVASSSLVTPTTWSVQYETERSFVFEAV